MRLGITQTSCNSLVIIKNNLKQPENNQKISSKNAITFIISRTVRRIVSTDDFVFKTLGEKRTTPYFLLFKSSLEQNKEKTDKNKNSDILHIEVFFHMARRDGFEPATASFEDSCSVQLSYRRTPRIISLSSHSCRMNQSLLSSLFLGDNVEFLGLFLENDDGEKQSVGGSCGFGKVTRPPNAVNAKEIAEYEAKEE